MSAISVWFRLHRVPHAHSFRLHRGKKKKNTNEEVQIHAYVMNLSERGYITCMDMTQQVKFKLAESHCRLLLMVTSFSA